MTLANKSRCVNNASQFNSTAKNDAVFGKQKNIRIYCCHSTPLILSGMVAQLATSPQIHIMGKTTCTHIMLEELAKLQKNEWPEIIILDANAKPAIQSPITKLSSKNENLIEDKDKGNYTHSNDTTRLYNSIAAYIEVNLMKPSFTKIMIFDDKNDLKNSVDFFRLHVKHYVQSTTNTNLVAAVKTIIRSNQYVHISSHCKKMALDWFYWILQDNELK